MFHSSNNEVIPNLYNQISNTHFIHRYKVKNVFRTEQAGTEKLLGNKNNSQAHIRYK